jgi:hypothetical protein
MYDEEEVPNVMCIVEKEVSLSQLKTIAVPLEEEEVRAPPPLPVTVPP